MRKLLKPALIALLLLACAALLGLYPYRAALLPQTADLPAAEQRLAPHLSLFTPEGSGPFPTVLVFHGCSGQSELFMRNVKGWLLPAGYAVMFVDSHAARGIKDWRPVCDGKRLWGNERAIDVYAALALARSNPAIDSDRLALLGYSHGGWTILDALSYDGSAGHGFPATGKGALAGVRGVITYYPYCGFPAHLRDGLGHNAPVLMFLGGKDHVTDHQQCLSALDQLTGDRLQLVQYGNADHVFDQRSDLNTYQPGPAQDAQQRALAFLRENLGPAQ
ncbi:dienelactone hydrolase family protein [Pseudomonas sp. JM0905a]|uniref:Dienelactone hydrolase family protein n=1 Tax=Metapseudomonas resinovorans TaxID=53412 RepID=A0ABT4XYR6_METRE|nr:MULTISPECIES: dienelactone hydrolase family protein [Pseudomonas]MBD2837155.1 dienelactone hydrolase family protein [Pseudomonas sp. JM0905a]MDA8481570.1 dienelactone hydrolase family protein [Pseudomonas resinovorans]